MEARQSPFLSLQKLAGNAPGIYIKEFKYLLASRMQNLQLVS